MPLAPSDRTPLCRAKGHTKVIPKSQLAHHRIPSSSPPSPPPEPPHHRHHPDREHNPPPRWPTPRPGVGRRPRPRPRRRRRGQRHHGPVDIRGALARPGRGQRQRRPHDGRRAGKGTRPHGVRRAPDGAVVVVGPKRRRPRARRSRRVGQVAVEVDASASLVSFCVHSTEWTASTYISRAPLLAEPPYLSVDGPCVNTKGMSCTMRHWGASSAQKMVYAVME